MRTFLDRLGDPRAIVADGAMGTMLLCRGLKSGECPESVNLNRPEWLEEIARAYLDVGAEIIQTNTFGGSPLKLAQYGLENRTEQINSVAVQAVRQVVQDKTYVSGSCGPCGLLLTPHGDADHEEVFRSFHRQITALVAAGVDLICVETMTDLAEAKLAVRAAKAVSASLPVMATMTFDATPRGFYTMMGVSVAQAAEGLAVAGADVVGSNCGNGIENMVRIAVEFRRLTSLPLIIQSNAGLPQLQAGELVYPESPTFMAEHCRRLLETGVRIIGGCCGTTPEHIAAIKYVVDNFEPS